MKGLRSQDNTDLVAALRSGKQATWADVMNTCYLRLSTEDRDALHMHGIDNDRFNDMLQHAWLVAMQTLANDDFVDHDASEYHDWLRRVSMVMIYTLQNNDASAYPASQIPASLTNDLLRIIIQLPKQTIMDAVQLADRSEADVQTTLKSFRDRLVLKLKSRPGLKNVGITLAMFQSEALQPITPPPLLPLQNPARTLKHFRESSDLDTGKFART